MAEQLTSPELTELLAFDAMEPIGQHRADLRMGILAQQIWRVNIGKGQQPPAPADFMPFVDKPKKQPEDQKSLGDRIVSFFKGVKARARS